MAEGLALREAVITGRRLNLEVVRFESDCSLLIKSINSGSNVAELHSIIADILSFAEFFKSVSFVWIPREKNRDADCLAKKSLIDVEPLVAVDAFIAPN
ncbi:hypothetical protein Bca4012_008810 [Brassica carinata]